MELFLHIGMFKSGSTAVREMLFSNKEILNKYGYDVKIDPLYKASHFLLKENKAFPKDTIKQIYNFLQNHPDIFNEPQDHIEFGKTICSSEFLFFANRPNLLSKLNKYENRSSFLTLRNTIEIYSGLFGELLKDESITIEDAKKIIFALNINIAKTVKEWSNYSDLTINTYSDFSLNDIQKFLNLSFPIENEERKNESIPLFLVEKLYILKKFLPKNDYQKVYTNFRSDIETKFYTQDCNLYSEIISFYKTNQYSKISNFLEENPQFEKEFSCKKECDEINLENNNRFFKRHIRMIFLKSGLSKNYQMSDLLDELYK